MNNFFEQQLFTSQYGSYAEDFDLLNRDGSAIWKIWIFFIVFFIGIILGGITFGASQPKKPATERSTGQQILKLLGILLLISSFGSLAYYGYMYVFKYLPQYYEWFDSLPNGAKTMITLNTIMNKFSSSK